MSRRSLPSLASEIEQSALVILAGGIGALAIVLGYIPLPEDTLPRAVAVAAAAVLTVLLVAAVARAISRRYLRLPLVGLLERAERVAGGGALSDVAAPTSRELAGLGAALQRIDDRMRRSEAAVRDSERMASVGRVAVGIAHEVGNPLSAIANYAHVLRARCPATPETDAAFAALENEIERIDRIVTGVLDYARPTGPTVSRVNVTAVLRQSIRLLTEQGVLRRVQLQTDISEAALPVSANAHELQQAFVNLLLNAVDAVGGAGPVSVYADVTTPAAMLAAQRPPPPPPGQPPYPRPLQPRLDAWLAKHAADMEVAKVVVADAGTGISADVRDRIFDPFYTTKGPEEGSGLGLAIVQRVVDAVQGVVWVQTSREGGAAFHILIPIAPRSATL
jgi:signal transduction histidine kinase